MHQKVSYPLVTILSLDQNTYAHDQLINSLEAWEKVHVHLYDHARNLRYDQKTPDHCVLKDFSDSSLIKTNEQRLAVYGPQPTS